jgi:tRNA-Thr(GGU) m(6)t(6)A37 methyltransferase TsaA
VPDASVDRALLYDVLHILDAPDVARELLAPAHRVLKPDGRLSVRDHHLKGDALVSLVTGGGLPAVRHGPAGHCICPVLKEQGMRGQTVSCRIIGLIHSEHLRPEETPIQPVFAEGCRGRVEVLPEFEEGLRDIEGFSHVYLVYHLHRAGSAQLTVKPFLDDAEHGVFATRSPRRPNAIGLSVVELVRREGNVLHVNGLDVLDGTPLLDIKPYVARFDCIRTTRNGWQDGVDDPTAGHRGQRDYRGPKDI